MKLKQILIFANLLLVLIVANALIFNKEHVIKTGQFVLLELEPVDPRSLMQGDYMELRYAVQNNATENFPKRGYLILTVDDSSCVIIHRVSEHADSVLVNQIALKYVSNDFRIDFGADSYFFQEGNADLFSQAKYGGIKANRHGNSVLIGLYDKNKNLILPSKE